jgi:2-dehydro-3-deoxygluconokinase
MKHDLFTFGETMALITPEADEPFDPSAPFVMRFGGAESNVAIAAARLGISATWYSRLGQDPVGEWIRRELGTQGVNVESVVLDPVRVTGLMLKTRIDRSTVSVHYYRKYSAASAMDPETFPYGEIADARWLHVTGITPALSETARAAWFGALAQARQHGVPISVDPNIRLKLWTAAEARETLLDAMRPGIELLLPNLDEAQLLFGAMPPEDLVLAAHAAGARLVALKLGDQGALLSDGIAMNYVPPWPGLPFVDPVGAGDSFAGGLIAGILKGLPFLEAARLGTYCGGRAVTRVGDWEAAPSWAEAATVVKGEVSR